MRDVQHFINGKAQAGQSGRSADIFNPNTGEVQARVALASTEEMDEAIAEGAIASAP